ncbi:unnamed protein product [Schistosoma curassoni]|uniref:Uncharacterized protein n=1 Tax=Schistosoma curassoni TaxID=6186 RepID=A0A183JUE7_9TREM|nr:unnamed protein product [Schistosoma curassoni]
MSANGISDSFSSNLDNTNALSSSSSATAHLINLVMQLRKVSSGPLKLSGLKYGKRHKTVPFSINPGFISNLS